MPRSAKECLMRIPYRLITGVCVVLAFAASSPAMAGTAPAHHHMIVAAEPLAAVSGLEVLRAGGSAVDAAISAQLVLTVVEPQSSGLGGGAVMLHYEVASDVVSAWDGRETAPAAAGPDLFLAADGQPLGFYAAGVGGRAVGVPGTLRMLEAAYRVHGRLPWPRLFADAIRLAEQGFPVPARLAAAIAADAPRLASRPAARALFFRRDGTPLPAGATLVNHPLAETLRALAAGGADALHRGPLAASIATAVRTDANPGLLTADDIAAYAAKRRDPVCVPYRARVVCGMGPPSSGGVTVAQTLGLLAHFDLPGLAHAGGTPGAEAAFLLVEAGRLAWADRALYLADRFRAGAGARPARGRLPHRARPTDRPRPRARNRAPRQPRLAIPQPRARAAAARARHQPPLGGR